jgi:HlyD family secretion protein
MAAKQSGGWLKWVIILLIVGAGLAGGTWYFKHAKSVTPQYLTITVGRDDLTQTVTATGTLNPVVDVQVGCQVSGIISKINVDFNSTVKSNEVIAQIDPSTYQAAVEQAQADLANSKANQELQQVETRRSAELFTNNLLSGSDYDTAVATLHEAEATVKIKQAVLDTAIANLGYCAIRSPVDGVVISRSVDVGQTVASSFNTPTLFEIANDLTKMQIDSNVAEADVGGIRDGQSVDFTVDAYPYSTFQGLVTQIRNAPTNANNVVTYDCVVGVTNSDYRLKPGMTANLSFIIAEKDNILNVPNSALRFHPVEAAASAGGLGKTPLTNGSGSSTTIGGEGHHSKLVPGERMVYHTVYVLSGSAETAKLQAVQIKTGITDGINTEVISGLKEGDKVVTDEILPGARSNAGAFGGGMPRMR